MEEELAHKGLISISKDRKDDVVIHRALYLK